MKKKIKAPIFLAAKTELFYGKMQLLPGEKITKKFFSGKSRISILKIQCKEKMKKKENIRIVNIFSRRRTTKI